MASPPAEHRFKKGVSGNPKGSSARRRELSKITHLSAADVASVGTNLLRGTCAQLDAIESNPRANVLERWLARLITAGMKDLDAGLFRVLFDRVVGKVKDQVVVTGNAGGPVETCNMTQEECIAKIERLRAIREQCGDD